MTANEIRQQFLYFFQSKKHQIVPSAPIVVKNDPTLLFTNAGMNQFKDYFLGNKQPEHTRIADTQKCLRVSGKHNDLEEVGVDTYHHTMFEMLGNWSFGDYFKTEAIAWSWELLVDVYKLDKDRLYVTIFEGDEKEGLPKDSEAYNEWKKVIAEDRILLGNKKDNFWEMGDTGPCGPCTEIHVDCRSNEERKAVEGKTLVNNDHPQVIEIWNNVFIQFNRKKDGSLEELPARHVDTGMGLERLVRVIQGKSSNYDTDLFTNTIHAVEQIVQKQYGFSDVKQDIAFRVIADHIRAISFTIADGQLPSNTGAGYVIRRILRRAVRYYYSYLDYKLPLLHQLIPQLATQFEQVFPELKQQQDFVAKVIKEEEDAFLRTVDKGLTMLNEAKANISGEEAFKLYDTFGFPLDLTKLVAAEKGLEVDEAGFDVEMLKQKTRSRSAADVDTEDWINVNPHAFSEFVGYDSFEVTTEVIKYRKVTSKGKEGFQIVLGATPFYAESGGQVGDTGTLKIHDTIVHITDTKKENNLIVLSADKLPADLSGHIVAKIDHNKRESTAANHTATHLLHAALRQVLGKHVAQKGSLVNTENLRFDFSHFEKVTDEQIAAIEKIVNQKIRESIEVKITEMKKDDAIALGAMALFGEKYGDYVRVVVIDPNFSVELCGGTHVFNTGELGFFKIKAESAVAAGVRRIEAVSGKAAESYIQNMFAQFDLLKEAFKNPKDLVKAAEAVLTENNNLKKQVESLETKQIQSLCDAVAGERVPFPLKGKQAFFIGKQVEVSNPDHLKKLCFELKPSLGEDYAVVLTANINGKPNVAIMLSDSMTYKVEANKLIKDVVAPIIKGGGGGQKTLATAGGQDASNLGFVITSIEKLIIA